MRPRGACSHGEGPHSGEGRRPAPEARQKSKRNGETRGPFLSPFSLHENCQRERSKDGFGWRDALFALQRLPQPFHRELSGFDVFMPHLGTSGLVSLGHGLKARTYSKLRNASGPQNALWRS